MAYANETLYVDVKALSKQFGMSVSEAANMRVPCGCRRGETMGTESNRSIYWFATRRVSTDTQPEMRLAIRAARLLRASRLAQRKSEEMAKNIKDQDGSDFSNALRVVLECLSCGQKSLTWRNILNRRSRPKCEKCGGTLIESSPLPIDEYLSLTAAANEYAISRGLILRGIKAGRIVFKRGKNNRYLVGRASLENECEYVRNEKALRTLGIKY